MKSDSKITNQDGVVLVVAPPSDKNTKKTKKTPRKIVRVKDRDQDDQNIELELIHSTKIEIVEGMVTVIQEEKKE